MSTRAPIARLFATHPDAPLFSSIAVGWESYQHDEVGAHEAFIDDVILDNEPIPCP